MNNLNTTSKLCDQITKKVKNTEKWLAKYAKENSNVQELLTIREVSDLRRHIGRLYSGFDKRSCLALYGGSQAGKSYVVSSLATSYGEPLKINFGEKNERNFIDDINPTGEGQESTAVVTRFTPVNISLPYSDFPVQIKLFSEADIIKILINTYCSDIDHDKSDGARQCFEAALEHATNSDLKSENIQKEMEMVLDVREYLQKFRTHAEKFEEKFWEGLAQYLSQSENPNDRAKILSPLWGGVVKLNEVFTKLYHGLLALDFSDQVYSRLEPTLMPSKNSIIKVSTLEEILLDKTLPPVTVKITESKKCDLQPSILSALTAELIFPIANENGEKKPWDFLKYADILDFPGARSRDVMYINNSGEISKSPTETGDTDQASNKLAGTMLLRGKVEYLYHRYLAESSINAMVMCIDPNSTQEVKELPGLIDSWVNNTFGKTPEQRARFDSGSGLIINLTKFDRKITPQKRDSRANQSNSDDQASGKWDSMFACLDKFKNLTWFKNWKNDGKFNNITLFRNSSEFTISDLFSYKEINGIEQQTGVRKNKKAWLDKLSNAFQKNQKTIDHVADKQAVWDGVLDKDGGVSYLARRISESFPENLKTRQIEFNLIHLLDEVIKKMEGFYTTGDADVDMQAMNIKENLESFGTSLRECHKKNAAGQFFYSLTADEKFCYRQLLEADKRQKIKPSNPDPQISAQEQAEHFKKAWLAELSKNKQSAAYLQRYHLNVDIANLIFSHLEKAFDRQKISEDIIQKELHKVLQHQRASDETLSRRAKICSEKLSEFIRHLDADGAAPEHDTDKQSPQARPFPPKPFKVLPPLEEDIQKHDEQYLDKWLFDFECAVKLNLNEDSGKYGREANDELKQILDALRNMQKNLGQIL